MSDTAEAILDAAQDLIQTGGYTAMRFQDIADRVGIKKPTIVHHFASKAILGQAVIRRYRERFADALEKVRIEPGNGPRDALEFYFTPYLEFAESPKKVCLCGALAGEIMVVTADMREEVERFFRGHQRWLEDILREGQADGVFQLADTPKHMARMFFSALQGALLVKRTTGDIAQLNDVLEAIRSSLRLKNQIRTATSSA